MLYAAVKGRNAIMQGEESHDACEVKPSPKDPCKHKLYFGLFWY